MNSPIQPPLLRRLLMPLCFFIFIIILYSPAHAQVRPQLPPKPISVRVYINESLNFGEFCIVGTGEKTVTVNTDGDRSFTGSVILMGVLSSAARFVVSAIPGTIIHIHNIPGAKLDDGHGHVLTLQIGDSWPLQPFIATGEYTDVSIGGTLSFNVAPAGNYSGTFSVIFMQE